MNAVEHPQTLHSEHRAVAIAAFNTRAVRFDEDSWSFTVKEVSSEKFTVEVRDETGFVVGHL